MRPLPDRQKRHLPAGVAPSQRPRRCRPLWRRCTPAHPSIGFRDTPGMAFAAVRVSTVHGLLPSTSRAAGRPCSLRLWCQLSAGCRARRGSPPQRRPRVAAYHKWSHITTSLLMAARKGHLRHFGCSSDDNCSSPLPA